MNQRHFRRHPLGWAAAAAFVAISGIAVGLGWLWLCGTRLCKIVAAIGAGLRAWVDPAYRERTFAEMDEKERQPRLL